MSNIPYGANPVIEGTFTDPDTGAGVDPTTVRFVLKQAGGDEETYTYGTDSEIVRRSAGTYEAILDPPAANTTWFYRWEALDSGGLVSARPGDFIIGPNRA